MVKKFFVVIFGMFSCTVNGMLPGTVPPTVSCPVPKPNLTKPATHGMPLASISEVKKRKPKPNLEHLKEIPGAAYYEAHCPDKKCFLKLGVRSIALEAHACPIDASEKIDTESAASKTANEASKKMITVFFGQDHRVLKQVSHECSSLRYGDGRLDPMAKPVAHVAIVRGGTKGQVIELMTKINNNTQVFLVGIPKSHCVGLSTTELATGCKVALETLRAHSSSWATIPDDIEIRSE